MDTIFQAEFPANYVAYSFCGSADVNLPENVKIAITEKETQNAKKNQKLKSWKKNNSI